MKKFKKFKPEWYHLNSTRAYKAAYNSIEKTVTVEFRDGVRWDYHNVTAQEWANFIESGSPGRYIFEILDEKPNGHSRL